ncbi:putative serine carboxypeptidase CPVL [Saccoglossus kowalevskii]|uniref:Probable serine carboxypeptidase CPVL-like n=1 Tax=Saccoglossus kowalevskii TaxID=10224 RepID=A0ABM0MX74_SACKO|nr:PREDICTED: probable serine carboxypeptidase CPVL-like [Saccoglossus kowalevskii]
MMILSLLNPTVLMIVLSFRSFEANARTPLSTIFTENYPHHVSDGEDPGKPLFLTPYLEAGKIEEARNLSLAGKLAGAEGTDSYTGFLTVNKKYNSNMFFWFVPAKVDSKNAPVLLWLQGGPGGSSLFGLFVENGPFKISKDFKLSMRPVTWQTKYSMLYIDNPVGTGFSFTDNDSGYARNETDVANDLYSALTQFFQIYYEYQDNEFYATGESYAGKYVPAICYKIHIENPYSRFRINLKGMAIGDGLIDPENMFPAYGDAIFNIGQIDEIQRDHFNNQTNIASKYIQDEQWTKCFMIFDVLLNGDVSKQPSYYYNASGVHDYYNFLRTEAPKEFGYYNTYLSMGGVRKAIHVGNLTYNDGSKVEQNLIEDICKSVKPWLIELLNSDYKVLLYSGQLDIIVSAPLTERFLWMLPWKHLSDYQKADRKVWKVQKTDTEVAGYVRAVGPGNGNFFQVIVRGAGHLAPFDQPERVLNMLNRFIEGNSWK